MNEATTPTNKLSFSWSALKCLVMGLFGKNQNNQAYPKKPQPCPHCGVETVRGWTEQDEALGERYFIQHGKPHCFAGSEKLEIFPLTDREIECFRYWTRNAANNSAA